MGEGGLVGGAGVSELFFFFFLRIKIENKKVCFFWRVGGECGCGGKVGLE